MTNHLKVYYNSLKIDENDIVCEVTGRPAYLGGVDLHHIKYRSHGKKEEVDTIENIISITRELHNFIHDNPTYVWWFHLVHLHFMITRVPYAESKYADKDLIFKEIYGKII